MKPYFQNFFCKIQAAGKTVYHAQTVARILNAPEATAHRFDEESVERERAG